MIPFLPATLSEKCLDFSRSEFIRLRGKPAGESLGSKRDPGDKDLQGRFFLFSCSVTLSGAFWEYVLCPSPRW